MSTKQKDNCARTALYISAIFSLLTTNYACHSASENKKIENDVVVQQRSPRDTFLRYLASTFHEIPPKSIHYYIIIPSQSCFSCTRQELTALSTVLRSKQATLISSRVFLTLPTKQQQELRRSGPVYLDTIRYSDNELDRLNLPFPAFTGVVKTQSGEVDRFLPFDLKTHQTVLGHLLGQ